MIFLTIARIGQDYLVESGTDDAKKFRVWPTNSA
jgi:hypothetical protein